MEDRKKQYYVQFGGQGAFVDEEKYLAKKDSLYADHPDAQVFEVESYANLGENAVNDTGGAAENSVGDQGNWQYLVQLEKDGEASFVSPEKFAKKRDQLFVDYPDARVSVFRPVNDRGNSWLANELGSVVGAHDEGNGGASGAGGADSGFSAGKVKGRGAAGHRDYEGLAAFSSEKANEYLQQMRVEEETNPGRLMLLGQGGFRRQFSKEYEYLQGARKLMLDAAKIYGVERADESNGFVDYLRNYGKGAADVLGDVDFYTRGIGEIARNLDIRQVANGLMDRGLDIGQMSEKELDENLTPGEKALLQAWVRKAAAQAARAEDMAGGYSAGTIMAESLGYMAEFLATGGIARGAGAGLQAANSGLVRFLGRELGQGSATAIQNAMRRRLISTLTQGGKVALNQGASRALGQGAKRSLSQGVRAGVSTGLSQGVGQGAKMAVRAGTAAATTAYTALVRPVESAIVHTVLQPSTYRAISNELTQIDNNGQFVEVSDVLWGTVMDQMIENWSESMGDAVQSALALPFKVSAKALEGTSLGRVVLGHTSLEQWGKWLADSNVAKVLHEAGFNGLIGEMGEEWLGNAARLGLGLIDEEQWRDFASFSQQLDMAAAFAPMSLFGLGTSSYAAAKQAKQYRNAVEAMRGVLQRAGMTEQQIYDIFDTKQTRQQISDALSPVLQRIVQNSTDNPAAYADYVTTLRFAQVSANNAVIASAQQQERQNERTALRNEIAASLGAVTDISENAESDISESSGSDISENGGSDISENRGINISENQGNDVAESQGSDVADAESEKLNGQVNIAEQEDISEQADISGQVGISGQALRQADPKGIFSYTVQSRPDADGQTYDLEVVTTVTDASGREYFVLGLDQLQGSASNETAQLMLKTRDGQPIFMSAEQYMAKISTGELAEETQLVEHYLDAIIDERKSSQQRQLIASRNDAVYATMQAQLPVGSIVNMGSESQPMDGIVVAIERDGVVLEFDRPVELSGMTRQVHKLSFEELGNRIGIDASVRSEQQSLSEQVDRDALNESRRKLFNSVMAGKSFVVDGQPFSYVRMFEAPFIDEATGDEMAMLTATNAQGADEQLTLRVDELIEQSLDESERAALRQALDMAGVAATSDVPMTARDNGAGTESLVDFRGNAIPMKIDEASGRQVVDQISFKEADVEAYYRWNDKRNGGDTSDTKQALAADIAAQVNERQAINKQLTTETNPETRDKLRSQLSDVEGYMNLLQGLLSQYAEETGPSATSFATAADGSANVPDVAPAEPAAEQMAEQMPGLQSEPITDEAPPNLAEETEPESLEVEEGSAVPQAGADSASYSPLENEGEYVTQQNGRVMESYVERVYRETGAYSFSGRNRIHGPEDVAYIFRELENRATENSFIVFVKDGVPRILHVGIGNMTSTIIDFSSAIAGYRDYGADIVYMVHNHPSGSLYASRADRLALETLSKMYDNQVPVEGIIIDTVSGKYGKFNLSEADAYEMPEEGYAEETNIPVYAFDEQVFAPNYRRDLAARKITGSDAVAAFLAAHRLGENSKMGALLLNNSNVVNANLVTNVTDLRGSVNEVVEEVVDAAVRSSARSVIIFGNFNYESEDLENLSNQLSKRSGSEIRVLDVVQRGLSGELLSAAEDTLPPYRDDAQNYAADITLNDSGAGAEPGGPGTETPYPAHPTPESAQPFSMAELEEEVPRMEAAHDAVVTEQSQRLNDQSAADIYDKATRIVKKVGTLSKNRPWK